MVIVKQDYGKTELPAISRFTFQYGYSKTLLEWKKDSSLEWFTFQYGYSKTSKKYDFMVANLEFTFQYGYSKTW